ncbi:AMP-binding protein [Gammaproteobacteria bacterium]|nr:AMP-binding protein [Gammaproteobacteria bacterium]
MFNTFPQSNLDLSLAECFQVQAGKFPDRLAVGHASGNLTYRQLNCAANTVAGNVVAETRDRERPVATLFDSDPYMVTAILGVLKAGRCCIPLDPSNPETRNRLIFGEVRPDIIVTNERGMQSANTLAGNSARVLDVADLGGTPDGADSCTSLPPGAVAFVLFTSGSTGQPKGVMVTQRQLMHMVRYHSNTRRISSDERLIALTRCHHIGGIADMFRALLNGAVLYPYDLRTQSFNVLINSLIDDRITMIHCVPTIFRALVKLLPKEEQLPNLRLIHLGGEPVTRSDVELFKAQFSSGCKLVNNFGSSETGPLGQFFVDNQTRLEGEIVPVHLGIEGKEIFLVNETPAWDGDGSIGEIVVRSRYMSAGYWSDTDAASATHLLDGCDALRTIQTGDLAQVKRNGVMVYLGRKDWQANISGNRVDLIEIEEIIRRSGRCEDVAVAVQQSAQGETRLVAYCVANPSVSPTAKVLRRQLADDVPNYMIPAEFIFLDELPRTSTGKIDRLALISGNKLQQPADGERISPGIQACR